MTLPAYAVRGYARPLRVFLSALGIAIGIAFIHLTEPEPRDPVQSSSACAVSAGWRTWVHVQLQAALASGRLRVAGTAWYDVDQAYGLRRLTTPSRDKYQPNGAPRMALAPVVTDARVTIRCARSP